MWETGITNDCLFSQWIISLGYGWLSPDFHSKKIPSKYAAPLNRLPPRRRAHRPHPFAAAVTLFLFDLNMSVSSCGKIFPKKQLPSSTKPHVTLVWSSLKLMHIGCLCSARTEQEKKLPMDCCVDLHSTSHKHFN